MDGPTAGRGSGPDGAAGADVLLAAARSAYARRDWASARRAFEGAAARGGLSPESLDALSRAAWWLGDVEAAVEAGKGAFEGFVSSGRLREAAMAALRLALLWALRGNEAIHDAWMARARRVLGGLPDGPEHGYLLYLGSNLASIQSGLPSPAEDAAPVLRALARAHGSRDLETLALTVEGEARILQGRTDAGFALLDEALLPVVDESLDPLWSGDIYCTVVYLCHAIGDFGRMRAWTDSLEAWSAELSRTFTYADVTRMHQLQLLVAEGRWDEAVDALGRVSGTLLGSNVWAASQGLADLGHVLRIRGQHEEATAAYERARLAGVDPEPGPALLAAAAGHSGAALDAVRAALADRSPLRRLELLLPAVELALEAGDRAAARGYGADLAEAAALYGTGGLAAWSAHAQTLLALDAGRPASAVDAALAAADAYRSQHLRHGLGVAHELLGRAHEALGEDESAEADRATALAIFRRLGAAPDAARVEAARTRATTGPLTAREAEVLVLVADGASNREVAERLVVSEKTVHRHLANIFTKLGVGSRTAAAAWAHGHGLVPHVRGTPAPPAP